MLDFYLSYLREQDDDESTKHKKLAKHYEAMAAIADIKNNAKEEYHAYLSMASKACARREKEDKAECMKNYSKNALRELRYNLAKAVAYCSDTINPDKCHENIRNRLDKIDEKIRGE